MAMKQSSRRGSARRRLPLSVRLSLLVLFAALLPLAAVVGFNSYSARKALVQQSQDGLVVDAKSRSNEIATYLHERVLDGAALSTLPTAQGYLACVTLPTPPDAFNCDTRLREDLQSTVRALNIGIIRDPAYAQWTLFDPKGKPLQSASRSNDAYAKNEVQPISLPEIGPLLKGQPTISPVYYDPQGKHAYLFINSPIGIDLGNGNMAPGGFLRATLRLDYISTLIGAEKDANGSGSYAFITDENGVRVADVNSQELFSSVAPLSADVQQAITSQQRFGSKDQVSQLNLPAFASSLSAKGDSDTFQSALTPGSTSLYQVARMRIHVPNALSNANTNLTWTYFVLSPLSTVTAVADDQVRISLLSAAVIAVLAILIGLLVGRSMARPVHTATENLQGAAASLKVLAARQESSASEQQWVVDACKTGLDSVRYLADAMNQAAKRVIDASNWFGEYWDRLTEEQARRTVQHLQELAHYIDEAARRQHVSSERLGKAITVTTQVSEQLVSGASAAKQSSDQLEEVVGNLQHVVGGRPPAPAPELEQADELDMVGRIAPSPAPARAGRSGRLPVGAPQSQGQMRQLAAPLSPAPMSRVSGHERIGAGRSGPGRSQVSPHSQVSPWQSDGRAPRAPYGPYAGARRPGQSQMFDGSGPSYPGADYAGSYGNGGGSGYDQEQATGRRGGNNGSRVEWDW